MLGNCVSKKVHYTLTFINKSNNSSTDDDVGVDDDECDGEDNDGDGDYYSQHLFC